MTELWSKVPQWLALDPGVRALPAPARTALYDLAMAGGRGTCGDDPAGALDALCAGAGASLPRMIELGAVRVEGARIYLMAPDGLTADSGPVVPHHGATQPRAADGALAGQEALAKRLSGLWSKAGAKTVEQRLAWLESKPGHDCARRERMTVEALADLTRRVTGSTRGRFAVSGHGSNRNVSSGSNSPTVGTVTAPTTAPTNLPSHALPSEKKNEETSEERARATAPTGSSNGSNHNGSNLPTVGATTAPTVERLTAVNADDVLQGMARASGDIVTAMAGSAQEKAAFGEVVRDYVANGMPLARIVAAAAHLQHKHWTQRDRRTVLSAARLVAQGHNGKPSILTELLTDSLTCERCNAPAHAAAPSVETPPAPIKKMTGDEARAIRAAVRATAEAKRKETAHARD